MSTNLPVYTQPPNQPDRQEHVCDVSAVDGERDVISAIGVPADRVVGAKRIGGRNPRWSVVVI